MPRGRKPKIQTEVVVVDNAKLLKQFEQEKQIVIEQLYKDLAKIKYQVDLALTQINLIDGCETLGEAAFKAGRAYGPLDEANDRLEQVLNDMFGENDFDHWDDLITEN